LKGEMMEESSDDDFELATCVDFETGLPSVTVKWKGYWGQLDLTEGRDLALNILEAIEAARSDAMYIGLLKDSGCTLQEASVALKDFRQRRKDSR
jgi:hypothetical protein